MNRINFPDAARYLGVSTSTLNRLVKRGLIRHYRISSHRTFDRADLDTYLQECRK